jgi:hypothetical protein
LGNGRYRRGGYTVPEVAHVEGGFVFDSEVGQPTGRYQMEMVTGELRQKSYQTKVQERLNEGAARGWRLVSATTTNATGSYVTGIYWDTAP